jgi:hypothetical protein
MERARVNQGCRHGGRGREGTVLGTSFFFDELWVVGAFVLAHRMMNSYHHRVISTKKMWKGFLVKKGKNQKTPK